MADFETERARLKSLFPAYNYQQAIDATVKTWRDVIYKTTNPSILYPASDYPAGQYKYASPDLATSALTVFDRDVMRNVLWNDFSYWAELQKSYKALLPLILDMQNQYLYPVAPAPIVPVVAIPPTQIIQPAPQPAPVSYVADVVIPPTQYNTLPQFTDTVNLPVPDASIVKQYISFGPESLSVPIVPLPETPLRAADAVSISTQTGPSLELGTKIALAPAPKSNTSLILAAAAAVGLLMLKRKK